MCACDDAVNLTCSACLRVIHRLRTSGLCWSLWHSRLPHVLPLIPLLVSLDRYTLTRLLPWLCACVILPYSAARPQHVRTWMCVLAWCAVMASEVGFYQLGPAMPVFT